MAVWRVDSSQLGWLIGAIISGAFLARDARWRTPHGG
jgi:hypothetical protein